MRFRQFFHRPAVCMFLLSLLAFCVGPRPLLASPSPEALQHYNQACEAELAGQPEKALESFAKAVEKGFDDFRYALADSELAQLTQTRTFQDYFTLHQSRLTLLSGEKGVHLQSETWSPWQKLTSDQAPSSASAEARFQWNPQGLNVELKMAGHWAETFSQSVPAPWAGGPGIVLTLLVPDETSAFESANTFKFAFGKSKTTSIGALWLGAALGWQPVHELAPEFSLKDQGRSAVVSLSVSWQSLLPFHPLVDNPLGVNLAVRDAGARYLSAALIPDPRAFSPRSRIHRFVPLGFESDSEEREFLVGRLTHSLVTEEPLQIDLALGSQNAGRGWIEVDFLDSQGRSVLPEGAQRVPHDFVKGRNEVTRQADFSALDRGPYLLKAITRLPNGSELTWSSQVLNLGPQWQEDFEHRIAGLKPLEQPTGRLYLETIVKAVQDLAPRRHPGSLTTTYLELETFLNVAQRHGSLLPEAGVTLVARPLDNGILQPVSLYLPLGYRQASSLEAVVLWSHDASAARRLAARLAKSYEHEGQLPEAQKSGRAGMPVYVIPHLTPAGKNSTPDEAAQLALCLDWAREFFQAPEVALVGVDSAAGAALELMLARNRDLSRMMIYAGARLEPWPAANEDELRRRFQQKPLPTLEITWLDFVQETAKHGQGKMLLSILEDSGYNLASIKEIRGGLSLTQVADRLALWAEGPEK